MKSCRNTGLQGAGEVPFPLSGHPAGSAPIPGVQKHNWAQNLPDSSFSPFPPVPHVGSTPSYIFSPSLSGFPLNRSLVPGFFFPIEVVFPTPAHKFRTFDSVSRVILVLLTQSPGCCWPFRLSPQKVPTAPFQIFLRSAFLSHESHKTPQNLALPNSTVCNFFLITVLFATSSNFSRHS